MNKVLVVAIDGTTARFFTCETDEFPENDGCTRLVEREQLNHAICCRKIQISNH